MIHTPVCDLLSIDHPVLLAGMGGGTNAELVAAVSEAGGLGVLACTWTPVDAIVDEIRRIRSLTTRPFGVNFVLHETQEDGFRACLAERVPVFSFFHGDPSEHTRRAHEAGAVAIYQATTIADAERAAAAGVDAIIAQGCEAGGHMGPLPLWSFLPEAIQVAAGRPVLAAGGIVDGQGLAAALCYGAAGVSMGTRFLASPEAPKPPAYKQAILDSRLGDTVASDIWDWLFGGDTWEGKQVRVIRNRMTERWLGHEAELKANLAEAQAQLQQAAADGDAAYMSLMAGVGSARIRDLKPAGDIVRDVIAEAEQILRNLNRLMM